jgi:hypothetical protein
MIVPVYFDILHPTQMKINEIIYIVNEEGAYSAYNGLREKVGKFSSNTKCNTTLSNFLNTSIVNGRVWAIFKNKFLVEITNPQKNI